MDVNAPQGTPLIDPSLPADPLTREFFTRIGLPGMTTTQWRKMTETAVAEEVQAGNLTPLHAAMSNTLAQHRGATADDYYVVRPFGQAPSQLLSTKVSDAVLVLDVRAQAPARVARCSVISGADSPTLSCCSQLKKDCADQCRRHRIARQKRERQIQRGVPHPFVVVEDETGRIAETPFVTPGFE